MGGPSNRRGWTLVVVLLATLAVSAAPVEWYVAADGRDERSGRSAAQAFATLARARDAARQARQAGQLRDGGIVHVGAGVYAQPETLAFGPDDAGTDAAPLRFVGAPNGATVIRGGTALTGFAPYRGAIRQLNLKAAGLAGLRFTQLFFAGRRMVLARVPNIDPADIHGGGWAHVVEPAKPGSKQSFRYSPKELDPGKWAHPTEGRVHYFPSFDWAFARASVAGVDVKDTRLDLGSPNGFGYELATGDRYFVEGLFEELDAPGEWYLDAASDTLYFQPPADLSTGEVVAARVKEILKFEKTRAVRFERFVIEDCDADAVLLRGSDSVLLGGCVVRNSGGWGINLESGSNCRVVGCDVTATGAGGVRVNGGDRATLTPGNNVVDNCYIHHIAAVVRTYNCAVNLEGVGNAVRHTLIHDTPHAGVALAGNNNSFEYNVVHHTNLQSTDTGGLYSCPRDWTQRGNIIRYNVWHDLGGFGKRSSWQPIQDGKIGFIYPSFTWGIYLDDPTSGDLVFGNILYRVPICALHNHGGRDNTWANNVIVDAPALNAGMLTDDWGEWPSIFKRLDEVKRVGSPYLAQYPVLGSYTKEHPAAMTGIKFIHNVVSYTTAGTAWLRQTNGWGNRMQLYGYWTREADVAANTFDHNLISAAPELELSIDCRRAPQPHQRLTWADWRKLGQDTHSQLGDPLFVDAAHDDYRLRPDSPAFKLGFEAIPVDQIGLYADPLRATWPVVEAPGATGVAKPIDRPWPVPGFEPLPAVPVNARGGLPNVRAKLQAGQPVTIAYFGGGINSPDGWRKAIPAWFQQTWPAAKVTFVDGSIGDATRGSGFSVYRFQHDVLRFKPDLVVIDYTSDDTEATTLDVQRSIEGVLRQARKADPQLDLLVVHAFRAGFETAYATHVTPPTITAYERLLERYQIPSINVGLAAWPLYLNKTWPTGHVPNAAADTACAKAAVEGLRSLTGGTPGPHPLPDPMRPDNLSGATQVAITANMLSGRWQELPPTDRLRRENARQFETIWYTNSPGAKLTFSFTGTACSLFDLMGPDTGRIRVTVDGQDQGIRQQIDPWSYYQRQSAVPLAQGLKSGVHTVTVELLPDPPDRTVSITEAKKHQPFNAKDFEGVALRIGWIRIVAPGP